MSFVIDYVQYTPWYDTFVGVSGTVSPPSNWHVIIPSSVTNSGTVYTVKTLFSAVFIHLTNLISIVLPDTITSFGQYPFYNCTSLTSIVLGANTVSISPQFAQLCMSLRNIYLPDTIQIIHHLAFANTGLTSIVLPNNPNLEIREKAFAGSAITNVTFPNYNVYLNGSWIFVDCVFLTSINFGNAIQKIPGSTFQSCTSLKNVVIPNSVTNIESACFANCSNLINIIIPSSVKIINDGTFQSCTSLKNVVIPNSVTQINVSAFSNCTSLNHIVFEDNIPNIANDNFGVQNDTVYYKSNTYNDSILSTIVPSKFTNAVTYTDINSVFPVNAPQNVTGIAGTNTVRITWSPVTNSETIDRYYISYYNIATPLSITTVNVPGNVTKSTITGLTNLQTYEFSVKAFVKVSYSVSSSIVQLTPAVSSNVPDAPQNVTGTPGINKVKISWSSVTTSETIYKYQISYYNITTPSSITTIDIPENNITQRIITGLTNDVTYEFSVKAFDIFSPSVASTVQITPKTFDTSSFTFEYIQYGVNNSGLPELVTQYVVEPPSNWDLTIPLTVTRSGTVYTVVSLGYQSFRGLSNLRSVIIPNSVTSIGNGVFYDCNSLTNCVISDSLITIGDVTFANCTSLRNVVIPNSVTYIGYVLFVNCTSLTSVILPNNLPYLPIEMFNSCVSLTNIDIPSSVTLIERHVFNNCFDLINITIPSSVKRIEEGAFQNCTDLTNFVIPNSVTSIGNVIFNGCNSLTNITISTGITSLPGNFFNTPFIRSFVVPENIKIISASCFGGGYIENLYIPDSVTSIGGNILLYSNVQLTSIRLPSNLTKIPAYLFNRFEKFSVNLANNIESIIPASVTEIDNYAFYWSNVKRINIPYGVTKIGNNVFDHCVELTHITFPNTLKIIGDYCFAYAVFRNFNIPSNVTSIGAGAFALNFVLTKITINAQITEIPLGMFSECQSLTKVNIPNIINIIRQYAFYATPQLINIFIPSSVTSIESQSFRFSGVKKAVFLGSTIPTIASNNFTESTDTAFVQPNTSQTELNKLTPFFSNITTLSLDPPQNVTGIAGNNSATISWTSSVPLIGEITKYQISYYDITTPSTVATLDVSGNVNQTTITGLTNNQTYGFSIKAFIDDTELSTDSSSTVQVTPFSLNAPQNVSGTAGVSSATISWSAVTVPVTITKYQINYFLSFDQSSVFNNIVVNTTTPWGTGNNIRNIAFALTADEKRAIRTSFDNSLIYLSSYNSSWSEFIQITDNVYRNYSGLALNADGSRGVACCGITSNGYIYYFTWTGTTYSTLTQILDTTDRNYMVISLSDDGSVLVVSSNTGIYFATWNGSNYSVLTKTLESRNISFIGANVSRDGLRIVYGANEIDNYVYWADWNGTNFNNGTLIDTIFISRCLYFASDKNIIWLTSANYTNGIPFLYYSTWNGTTYNPFTSLPLSSIGYIDGWGLWVNSNGNNVYLASFNTGSYYKFNFPSHITTFTPLDVSGNITQKVITGLTNNQNYSFSVKAFINDASSVASSSVQVTPFSLNAPQNVSGTIGINSAIISWSAVTVPSPNTITKYQINYYDITTPSNISTLDVSGNITQSKISSLTGNVTYEFSVKVISNDLFLSDDSSKVQVTPFSLNAPQNVTGTIGISSATISWSAVTAHVTITKYQIIYYDISNSSNISTLDVSANLTQIIITSLTNDVTYEFSVKAFINDDSSVASSSVQVTPLAINTPQNFTGVSSVNRAIINWSEVTVRSPYTITKYQIRYYDISNSSIINTVDISGNITQTTISELTGNVTYEFSIKAFVNNLSSVDSSKIQITPFSLNPPQNVTGIENINNGATISWSAVILPSPNVITKYQLSYYNITTQSNIITLDLSGNVNQIILTNLTNNETYEFSVKSFMNNFSSIDSSTNQVTPFVVGIPQNVFAVPALNSATISWSTVIIPSPYIITKYQVSYYNTITPEVISIGETNTTSLTINGIKVNKIYNFSVKAFFYSNSSELSSIVSIELSVNNILNEGLKNINNEPPPPTFLYDLVTSSSFTTEEIAAAGITVFPIITSNEEQSQQQQVQSLVTYFTSLGLTVNYNI